MLQDKNPIADVLDHAKVMGNEQIRDAHPRLQFPQKIQNLCLDRRRSVTSRSTATRSVPPETAPVSARGSAASSRRIRGYNWPASAEASPPIAGIVQPTCTRTACFGYGYVNPVQEPHPRKIKDLNAQVQIAKAYPATNMAEKTVC
ncbi:MULTISPECIES: hypothetical protein [Sinorhizobium]|uniref:hypothetical protein n=1 Tax=Sinorhizobium TaxID=28105 RepID=UPI0012FC6582